MGACDTVNRMRTDPSVRSAVSGFCNIKQLMFVFRFNPLNVFTAWRVGASVVPYAQLAYTLLNSDDKMDTSQLSWMELGECKDTSRLELSYFGSAVQSPIVSKRTDTDNLALFPLSFLLPVTPDVLVNIFPRWLDSISNPLGVVLLVAALLVYVRRLASQTRLAG